MPMYLAGFQLYHHIPINIILIILMIVIIAVAVVVISILIIISSSICKFMIYYCPRPSHRPHPPRRQNFTW